MTVSTIIGRVRANLFDAGITFFQDGDILDSINDGYMEVSLLTQCIEKTANLLFVNGLVYYSLYDLIPDYYKTLAIFNYDTNRWVESKAAIVFDTLRIDWEECNGTPWYYSTINFQYTTFFPHLPSGTPATTSNFDVLYKAIGDNLVDNSIPNIPEQYCSVLEYFATADMMEMEQRTNNAADWWEKYDAMLGKLRDNVAQRMNGDKMRQYTPEEAAWLGI